MESVIHFCMLPFYIGAHDELIKDVDGAYSQLIRLQEGEKESQKSEADKSSHILNSQMSRSSNQRISFAKSTSQRSSGRLSQSQRFSLPHQTEESNIEEGQLENKKRKNVSIRRLANLNKPEVPVLLLGSIAAIGNGVVFPIFGLVFSSAITMFYKPPEQQKKDARLWSLLYVGLGLFTLVVLPLQNYFFGVAGGKLVERIRSLTFTKVVHQEISWFDNPANSRYVKNVFFFKT
jgi:ATP-binding cassette subfamily B (MDR/TAP) protein 1